MNIKKYPLLAVMLVGGTPHRRKTKKKESATYNIARPAILVNQFTLAHSLSVITPVASSFLEFWYALTAK